METNQEFHRQTGRKVASAVIGVVVGVLLPIAALFQISMLAPVLMAGGIFAAFLFARSGWTGPAAVLAGTLAGWQAKGLHEGGAQCCYKHLFCNNAELGRLGSHTVVSRQALRAGSPP